FLRSPNAIVSHPTNCVKVGRLANGRREVAMLRVILLCAAVLAAAFLISANISKNRAAATGSAAQGDVQRGKYLVEEVARCPECHTPRDANGALKTAAWLRGATIWIRPVQGIANWADSAPP